MLEIKVTMYTALPVINYLLCYSLCSCSDYGSAKSTAAIEYHQKAMRLLVSVHAEENEKLKVRKYKPDFTETTQPEKTWFALAKEEVS